jgi:hypothetical protein
MKKADVKNWGISTLWALGTILGLSILIYTGAFGPIILLALGVGFLVSLTIMVHTIRGNV